MAWATRVSDATATSHLFVMVAGVMVPWSAVVTDICCTGSRPFLAFVGVVPRPVESGRRRTTIAYAVPSLSSSGRDREGGSEAHQGDCLEHFFSCGWKLLSTRTEILLGVEVENRDRQRDRVLSGDKEVVSARRIWERGS
jgi:hypothetical protein